MGIVPSTCRHVYASAPAAQQGSTESLRNSSVAPNSDKSNVNSAGGEVHAVAPHPGSPAQPAAGADEYKTDRVSEYQLDRQQQQPCITSDPGGIPEPIPLQSRAVTVKWLERFLKEHEEAKQMTTTEVVEKIIIPETQSCRLSFIEMELLHQQASTHEKAQLAGQIDVFVSHAWKASFGVLVGTLRDMDQELLQQGTGDASQNGAQDLIKAGLGGRPAYYWLDIFAITQHSGERQQGELRELATMVAAAKVTAAIQEPWQRPFMVTRLWCLFELLKTAEKGEGALVFRLSRAERDSFTRQLVTDFDEIERCIATLDARDAEASYPSDNIHLKSLIQETIGFDALNRTIQAQLRGWLSASGLAVLDAWVAERGERDAEVLQLQERLALLLAYQNKLDLALGLAQRCLAGCEQVHGGAHARTCAARRVAGMSFSALGRMAEALEALAGALKGFREALGPTHADTLRCANDYGQALKKAGRHDEAEAQLRSALEECRAALGPRHKHTLSAMSNLARLYRELGRCEQALPLSVECMEIKVAELTARHPSALMSMADHAVLLHCRGEQAEALALMAEVVRTTEEVLSPSHRHTLMLYNNQAYMLQHLGAAAPAAAAAAAAGSAAAAAAEVGASTSSDGAAQQAQALGLYLKAYEGMCKQQGRQHLSSFVALVNYCAALAAAGQADLAWAVLQRHFAQGLEQNEEMRALVGDALLMGTADDASGGDGDGGGGGVSGRLARVLAVLQKHLSQSYTSSMLLSL